MSWKPYPVTKTALDYDGYEVRINGIPVETNTARVSAAPFNRRWPGHQRDISQTELINFVSLETDEPLTFEIVPKTPCTSAVIRPRSLGITPQVTADGHIVFTLEKPAYFTVEPYGLHNALHIFADAPAQYAIDPTDENVIYFGAGEHDVGMITLHSNQTLFLDEGAVVYACVRAIDAENVRILGRGILDNSRNREQILFEANEENNWAAVNNAVRLHTIQPEYCTDLTIEGITIRDSLVYNVRPVGCSGVDIRNVKIIGCWRYNSDGIDMHNCTDVLIDNCFLRTFDDAICVKGFDCYYDGDVEQAVYEAIHHNGKVYDAFRCVLVKNCVIWNDWGKALEIGAETRAEEISDIVFSDCDVIHVCATVLDCMNVDYADVHNVVYQNINVEFDEEIPVPMIQKNDAQVYENHSPDFAPDLLGVSVLYHAEYSAGGSRRGRNRDIAFRNIHLYGRQRPKFCFRGCSAAYKTSDIVIEGIFVNDRPLTADGYDLSTDEFCKNITVKL